MDIKAFIRELLFGHDCVILPGFGGFIGNYTPAFIDKNSGTFYPPVKKISFNRNLNHNDGLLVGRISKSAGLNYGDARNLVEEFVRDLTARLSRGEKVVFDHIGIFVHNHENNVQFEPDHRVNYHLGSYGLDSFQYSPVEKYDVRKRIIRHIDKDPVRQSSVRRNIWRAVVAIPLLALLFIIPLRTDVFRANMDSASLNPLVAEEFENNRKAIENSIGGVESVSEDTPVVSIPEGSSVATPAENVSAGEVSQTPVETSNYRIITGSFKSEENAMDHVNILKADGFEPVIIRADNGFFRVNAMTCTSITTALSKMDSISKKFPGSWISKR